MDAAAKALSRFEEYTRYRDFKAFHTEQASAFKQHLAEQRATVRGEAEQGDPARYPEAAQTVLRMACREPDTSHAFSIPKPSISTSPIRIRGLRPPSGAASADLEQVKRVIATMPNGNEIERRNRAFSPSRC